ncbi:MAG: hypothetical protein WCQ21_10170 [Verrucomicrobiota bacterium]
MNVISRIGELLGGPQNMAGRPAKIAVQPQSESSGNIAAAVNSGAFGPPDPNSPMDKAVVRPALPPGLLDNVPHPTPDQIRAFDEDLATDGYKRPEATFRALQMEDEPYLRVQRAIAQASRSQHPAYMAHIQDIASRTAAGDETANDRDAWTKADFEEDSRERLTAFKAELRKIALRAWVIAEPALLEKAEFASRRADQLDALARKSFDLYRVAYQSPAYILLLRKYAQNLSNGSRRNVGLPTAMIETL